MAGHWKLPLSRSIQNGSAFVKLVYVKLIFLCKLVVPWVYRTILIVVAPKPLPTAIFKEACFPLPQKCVWKQKSLFSLNKMLLVFKMPLDWTQTSFLSGNCCCNKSFSNFESGISLQTSLHPLGILKLQQSNSLWGGGRTEPVACGLYSNFQGPDFAHGPHVWYPHHRSSF